MSKTYSLNEIVEHLENIKQSLKNDVGLAIESFERHNLAVLDTKGDLVGFFAVLRMVLPEIDCLGSYYLGTKNDTPRNAIEFLKTYHGKINSNYTKYAAFLYLMYRHGLMHQHEPKHFQYKYKNLGWSISLGSSGLRTGHLKRFSGGVQLDATQFYRDTIEAIEKYIYDIKRDHNLVVNFNKALTEMRKPLNKTSLIKKHNYISNRDFDFLKDAK